MGSRYWKLWSTVPELCNHEPVNDRSYWKSLPSEHMLAFFPLREIYHLSSNFFFNEVDSERTPVLSPKFKLFIVILIPWALFLISNDLFFFLWLSFNPEITIYLIIRYFPRFPWRCWVICVCYLSKIGKMINSKSLRLAEPSAGLFWACCLSNR